MTEKHTTTLKVSRYKYYDDLLKQNSLVYNNWKVYRWVYNQLKEQPEKVKDQLLQFLGEVPLFRLIEDFLPQQKGSFFECKFELKEHQISALENLQNMRKRNESIALLYHATGAGKTVTAVTDAKNFGERTLFIAHTKELIKQAKKLLNKFGPRCRWEVIWEKKKKNAYVVCGSVQNVSQNLDDFAPDEFGYLIIDECHHSAANTYKRY